MPMKRTSSSHWLGVSFGSLVLSASLAACTTEEPLPEGPSGGSASVAGSSTSGGSSSSGAGGMAVPGGAGTPAQSGAGGNLASGGGGGASAQAGTSGGGASSGAANAGNGGSGGAGGGSGAGNGGLAGGGAGGGGAVSPAIELNGESWTMKCSKPDTDPNAGDRCWLLPPGQNTCPASGYTSLDKTLHFGGSPGTIYQVTIRFQGTHEAGDYQGGTKQGPKGEFLKGATHIANGLHTWLSMEVSSPAATYNPNSGGGGGSVQVYDYTATIPIEGGATVRLKAADIDCLMHRYCQPTDAAVCRGYVLPPISPAASPIDGSFLQMTVMNVTPM